MKTIIVLSAVILFLAGSACAQDITVQELHEKLEAGENVVLVDVRESWEHAQDPVGGIRIPLGEFSGVSAKLEELEVHKNDLIVVYDKSGQRAGPAWLILINRGFAKARPLRGGMEAWVETYGVDRFTPAPKPKAPPEPAQQSEPKPKAPPEPVQQPEPKSKIPAEPVEPSEPAPEDPDDPRRAEVMKREFCGIQFTNRDFFSKRHRS